MKIISASKGLNDALCPLLFYFSSHFTSPPGSRHSSFSINMKFTAASVALLAGTATSTFTYERLDKDDAVGKSKTVNIDNHD